MQKVNFVGLSVLTGALPEIAQWLSWQGQRSTDRPQVISHINANNYYLLHQNQELLRQLDRSSYLLFDGIGMKLGAYLLGLGWLPDLNGTDMFPLVMDSLAASGTSVYLLGGDQHVNLATKESIQQRWPQVSIAGSSTGYFDPDHERQIIDDINASGAQILLVGMGFPLQEHFSLRHRDQLQVSVIWNVGGLFDFVSGKKPRAPLWIRQWRVEWLFRLLREPTRLWRRTVVVTPWLLKHLITARKSVKAVSWRVKDL